MCQPCALPNFPLGEFYSHRKGWREGVRFGVPAVEPDALAPAVPVRVELGAALFQGPALAGPLRFPPLVAVVTHRGEAGRGHGAHRFRVRGPSGLGVRRMVPGLAAVPALVGAGGGSGEGDDSDGGDCDCGDELLHWGFLLVAFKDEMPRPPRIL